MKKDGSYPLIFRIYHEGKTSAISTKIYIPEKQWDASKRLIKGAHPQSSLLNTRLTKDLAELQSELLMAGSDQITNYLTPKPIVKVEQKHKLSVFEFVIELISELRLDNKIGNTWVYESTLNALRKYHPGNELYFEQIDYQFFDKYNKHLMRSGVKHNTVFFNSLGRFAISTHKAILANHSLHRTALCQ